MERFDASEQALVVPGAGTRRALPPIVVTARGDLEATAHQAGREGVAAALDLAISHFDTLAKNAAASFKKSRSFRVWASSRLRVAISSSRSLPLPGKTLAPLSADSRHQRFSRFGLLLTGSCKLTSFVLKLLRELLAYCHDAPPGPLWA